MSSPKHHCPQQGAAAEAKAFTLRNAPGGETRALDWVTRGYHLVGPGERAISLAFSLKTVERDSIRAVAVYAQGSAAVDPRDAKVTRAGVGGL